MRLKETHKRWLITIFTVLFLLAAYKVAGQPMKFYMDSTEIYVGIIKANESYYLSVSGDEDYDVGIVFIDGSVAYIPKSGSRIRLISKDVLKRLKTTEFGIIIFESEKARFMCDEIVTRDYFIKQLK